MPEYRRFQCNRSHDRRQFTAKTGTVMEDSPLGLDKWAVAFWLEVNAKNSISSYEVHRALGVTQKSAWFMLHRIRLALKAGSFEKMGGKGSVVEADETFIGGLSKNMHASRRRKTITGSGSAGKAIVMGVLERGSKDKPSQVRAHVIPDTGRDSIHPIIHKHVADGSHVYTDAYKTYRTIGPQYYHAFVDHIIRYVDGQISTQGIDNFWALFKRCLKGTHVSVEPFHLEAYVDSEAFRFNNREVRDAARFFKAVGGAAGKRLTYKTLIGKDDSEGALGSDRDAAGGSPIN
jgi:transposase-like protein